MALFKFDPRKLRKKGTADRFIKSLGHEDEEKRATAAEAV